MFRITLEWLQQRDQTTAFPNAPGRIEGRFRGRPEIDPTKCQDGCRLCAEACPTDAIEVGDGAARIDLGKCVFCPICVEECPEGAITYTSQVAMATTTREALVQRGKELELAKALDAKMQALFGRSLRLRQVSAGGCSGCEAELVAAGNVVFDLSRFGIGFVASPRHADGIVVTGPITENMRSALLETYAAVPEPKLVIAVGACAISGGIFATSPQTGTGLCGLMKIDLFIPGCPPHPLTVLDGLLRLLGKMPGGQG